MVIVRACNNQPPAINKQANRYQACNNEATDLGGDSTTAGWCMVVVIIVGNSSWRGHKTIEEGDRSLIVCASLQVVLDGTACCRN